MSALLRFLDEHFEAILAFIGVVSVPALVWRLNHKQTQKAEQALDERVGKANGLGTVVEMLERSLVQQGLARAEVNELRQEIRRHTEDPTAHR